MEYIIYDEKAHGVPNYPEGFYDLIKDLPIEKQLKFFRIGNGLYRKYPFSERRKTRYDYSNNIDAEEAVSALIINNGVIAGVMVKNCHNKLVPCLPENGYIIRDDDELDGSGYKNFTLYLYLICVSDKFDEPKE